MPQIIASGAPPPNPQVIAGDSTEIAEDSAPAELTTARIGATTLARRVGLPRSRGRGQGCVATPPGGTAGRGHGRGSSEQGRALGAASPSVTGLGGQAVPDTVVGVPRGSVAGDRAGAPATAGASGHRRSAPKINHFSSSSQAATGFPSCQHLSVVQLKEHIMNIVFMSIALKFCCEQPWSRRCNGLDRLIPHSYM
jgi:hypothetical protein